MTKPIGAITLVAPCGGARYTYPHYTPMKFTAWAHWTDGWCEQGRFDEAPAVLQSMEPKDLYIAGRLIARLIEGKERGPMRYGM